MKRVIEGVSRDQASFPPENGCSTASHAKRRAPAFVAIGRTPAAAAPSRAAVKSQCRTGKQRRVFGSEHEAVLEIVQRRLDEDPQAMRQRRETVEHPFGTIKFRIGATPY